jgi:hypothetical protein
MVTARVISRFITQIMVVLVLLFSPSFQNKQLLNPFLKFRVRRGFKGKKEKLLQIMIRRNWQQILANLFF